MFNVIRAYNIPLYAIQGFEADDIIGTILDSFNSNPVTNAEITIDYITTFSDSTGSFLFQDIPKSTVSLSVKSQNYIDTDTTFFLDNNKNLQLQFSPILVEYFPIKDTNFWKYSFSYSRLQSDGQINANGKVKLSVVSEDIDNEIKQHMFNADLDYIHIDKRWTFDPDTTIVNEEISFSLQQDTKGLLKIYSSQNDFFLNKLSKLFGSYPIYRFYPVYVGDSFLIPPHWIYIGDGIYFEKEKGITKVVLDIENYEQYPGIFKLFLTESNLN